MTVNKTNIEYWTRDSERMDKHISYTTIVKAMSRFHKQIHHKKTKPHL